MERREITSFNEARGYRVVWCWEILSGPAKGQYGGKCGTKAEARKTARMVHNAFVAEEQELPACGIRHASVAAARQRVRDLQAENKAYGESDGRVTEINAIKAAIAKREGA